MKKVLIECRKLNYSIGYKQIFKDLSLCIYENDFSLLLGENGAGKSTLLKLIFARHKDFFFQKDLSISYLGHSPGLYTSLTLKENLEFFSKLAGVQNPLQVQHYLEIFNLKKNYLDPIHTFSEGMKKKSSIIRSLLFNPELWLLDEPFNGLDQKSSLVLKQILKEFKGSIVLVTHKPEDVKEFAHNVYEIQNKTIVKKNVASIT
ncbi:MAG: ABC transporter ATP-binding protein [Leptospiraceae bacterium]|nr:ABC transporter ATP-binding protein [Leptospiraceae bacterium]